MSEDAGHDIGSIVGYLKLDLSDFLANIDRADRAADDLGRVSPTIRVRVDDASAIASLQAIKAQADRVADSNVKIQKTAQDAAGDQGLGLIAQAAIALGPAVGPLLGAAAAGAGALAFLGAAGVAAYAGIGDQIGLATNAGLQFQRGAIEIQADLAKLQTTASGAFAAPFSAGVRSLNGEFPQLNNEIAYFAQVAGEIADHALNGVIKGFNTLTPLFQFAATGLEHGAEKFEQWSASTGGVTKFASYAQVVLPQVVATLSSLIQAIVHVGAAFTTTGLTSLSVLRLTADAINALPLPVLQALAIAVESGYAAWKLYQGLNFVVDFYSKVTAKMTAHTAANAANTAAAKANTAAQAAQAAAEARLTAAQAAAAASADRDTAAQAELAAAQRLAATTAAQSAASQALAGAGTEQAGLAAGAAWVANGKLAIAQDVASASAAELAAAQTVLAAAETEAAAASQAASVAAGEAAAAGEVASAALGPIGIIAGVAAAGLAVFGFTSAKSGQNAQQAAAQVQSLTSALEQSNGAIDDNVRSTAAKALSDAKAFAAAQQLGLSSKTVTDALLGNVAAQGQVNDAIAKANSGYNGFATSSGKAKAAADTLGNAMNSVGHSFDNAVDNQKQLATAMDTSTKASSGQNDMLGSLDKKAQALGTSVQVLANTFNTSAQEVMAYAGMLGIVSDSAGNYSVTNNQLASAVVQVRAAYDGASQSATKYLDAVAAFSQSTGEAADKAKFIGATLVAAQGDLLGYTGALAGTTAAIGQLTSGFDKSERAAITYTGANGKLASSHNKLTTATIDYTKAGAAPLVSQLQAMQDAAEKAAEATYQHEIATKGAGTAAADAANIFKTQTYTALVSNAKQLGLTKDQATALANQYFAMPKDVTTQVQSIGLNDINTTLQGIGQQLSYLTKVPFNINIDADTATAEAKIAQLKLDIGSVNGVQIPASAVDATQTANAAAAAKAKAKSSAKTVPTPAPKKATPSPTPAPKKAAGGLAQGAGNGTSDSILTYLSNGEFVVPAKQTALYLPVLETLRTTGQMPTIQGPSPQSPAAHAVHVGSTPTTKTTASAGAMTAQHAAALIAEVRLLQAAVRSSSTETGHAVGEALNNSAVRAVAARRNTPGGRQW